MKLDPRTKLAAAGVLVAAFVAAPTLGDYYYESRMTTTTEQSKRPSTMVVQSWVDGEKAKVLFVDGDEGVMRDGTYLLTTDGGENLYLVNPEDKTYFRWSLDDMFAGLSALMDSLGDMMSMDFSDPEWEKLGEEPGGEILGRPTRKITTRTSYTLNMKMMGMKRNDRVESTQETWVAPALDDLGFGIWLRRDPPKTGDEEFDEMIARAAESIEDGFPLRTKTESKTTDKKGRSSMSSMLMEVTQLREEDVADATFEIPADYEEIEVPALAAGGDEEDGGEGGLGGVFKSFGFGKKKKDKD